MSNNYTPPEPQAVATQGGAPDPFRVTLCEDGVYRWIHEYNMFKNPTILYTVYKVMFMSVAIVAIIGFIIMLLSGDLEWPPFQDFSWENSKYGIIVMAFVIFVLPLIGYLIVAKLYGGKYMVLFEMDEETIAFHQMEQTFKKSQAISWLTGLAGVATGNLAMTGMSMANSTRQSMVSEYPKVRKIIPRKRRGLIKVNHRFLHNQIYVCQEDFDFVLKYLREHTGK